MFGRSKQQPQPEAEPALADPAPADGRKGRPTPKRKEQQAARRVPMVPADRDAAKKAAREKARTDRTAQREAMARGDEKALPPRDRGPVRRYLRDAVDSRLNVGEILLPLMLLVIVLMMVPNDGVKMVAMGAVWLIVIAGVIDAVLLWRRTKKEVVARFGEEPARGSAWYTVMRSLQMRVSRLPKPQVKRGDKSWKQAR